MADVTTGALAREVTNPQPGDLSNAEDATGTYKVSHANLTKGLDAAEIKSKYEGNVNTNNYSDAEKAKLAAIEANANAYVHPDHTGDVTSNSDGLQTITAGAVTNAKLAANSVDASKIADGSVTTPELGPDAVTNDKLAANAVAKINIQDNAVSNDKMSDMVANSIKGRQASTGDPEDLTADQARAVMSAARWRQNWVPSGSYLKDDMVYDDGYLMIANKATDDKAAPEAVGDPANVIDLPGAYTWSEMTASVSGLILGTRYFFAGANFVNSVRYWLADDDIGFNVSIWINVDPLGDAAMRILVPRFTVSAGMTEKWNDFPIGQNLIPANTTFDIVMLITPPTVADSFITDHDYKQSGGNASSGEINHQGGSQIEMRVHQTDKNSTNWDSSFANLGPGSTIQMATSGFAWTILTAAKITGTNYSFNVEPSARAEEDQSNFTWTHFSAAPIVYDYVPNHYQSVTYAKGLYSEAGYDGTAIVPNDNAYPIDIVVQAASISPDWDLMSAPGGSGGGGNGGGGVTDHGNLTGLTDDDHLQYHTDARGDARYSRTFHTHVEADITDLSYDALSLRGVSLNALVGTPSDGDILVYRSAGGDWVLETKPAGGSNPALGDLTDVTIAGAADNNLLAFNNATGEWTNQTAGQAGVAPASHTHDADDVVTGTFNNGRISQQNVTQHQGAIDHNSLLNYDIAQHRVINDGAASTTNLWSGSKINTELGGKAEAVHTHTEAQITDLGNYVPSDPTGGGSAIINMFRLTQAQYDALTPDANTFYVIVG